MTLEPKHKEKTMPDFLATVAGQRYINSTLPQHTKAMNRLAEAIEQQNKLLQDKAQKENTAQG